MTKFVLVYANTIKCIQIPFSLAAVNCLVRSEYATRKKIQHDNTVGFSPKQSVLRNCAVRQDWETSAGWAEIGPHSFSHSMFLIPFFAAFLAIWQISISMSRDFGVPFFSRHLPRHVYGVNSVYCILKYFWEILNIATFNHFSASYPHPVNFEA